MKNMIIFVIIILISAVVSGDPCYSYQTIDTWQRSVANSYGEACDSLLPSGWYRIISKAGELMPTECVQYGGRCGTTQTVWMNGTYPDDGETVSVTACTSDLDGNCCVKSYDIQIKNCTSFYVYYLVPVFQCPQAYCFGTELPCPTGQSSENGFTPGCQFDPCLDVNYVELNDWKRSFNYSSTTNICDFSLEKRWYRPVSEAGNSMPTECPIGGFRCGTVYPIWMNDSLPATGQTINTTACVSSHLDGCCWKSYDIQVKNCDGFYVYNLEPISGCNTGYCFGTEIQCPLGETSDNGFTPGCEFDPCQNYQTKNGEVKRSSSYTLDDGDTAIDDSNLQSGWYRFQSSSGNELVNSSQELNKCGTKHPVWMQGTTPSASDKTVNRTCCLSDIDNTCKSTIDIQVRKCVDFTVYNLQPLQRSQSAYCVGTLEVIVLDDSSDNDEENGLPARTVIGICLAVLSTLFLGAVVYFSHNSLRRNCAKRVYNTKEGINENVINGQNMDMDMKTNHQSISETGT